MLWILTKIRVINIGRSICLLTPSAVLASYTVFIIPGAYPPVGGKSPEAIIQLFYHAAREGKYTEARRYLSQESKVYIKDIRTYAPVAENWVAIADKHTKDGTLQTVEVSETTTFDAPDVGEEAAMCSVVTRFADGSDQKLRIALVKEGDLWKIFWAGKLKVEQAFQDYVVRIYSQDPPFSLSHWSEYFEILQGGRRVYVSHINGSLSSFELGQFDWVEKANKLIAMGKDITGNGTPNLVLSEWAGSGTHCCSVYYIFEIGREFRKIAELMGGDGPVDFTDLDGDSKLEVVLNDWSFAYFLTYFAAYRPPDVILRYQDGTYRIAADLMHKPAPSRVDLVRRAQQAREDASWRERAWLEWGWVPQILGATLLELLYTGHPDLAWQFLEMAWPPDISGKDAWLSVFRTRLERSPFWPLDSKLRIPFRNRASW